MLYDLVFLEGDVHFFILVICQNRIILSGRSLDFQGIFNSLRRLREYVEAGKDISITIKTTDIHDPYNQIRYLPLRSFVPINRTADYEIDDDDDDDDDEYDDGYNDYTLLTQPQNDDLDLYHRDMMALLGSRGDDDDDDDDEEDDDL